MKTTSSNSFYNLKPTTSKAFYLFATHTLHIDHDGPINAEDQKSIWNNLPLTGALWVDRGRVFVQDCDTDDDSSVRCLGEAA